jgi:gamma-glutamyltranspeptidase/glutathione hydrolase
VSAQSVARCALVLAAGAAGCRSARDLEARPSWPRPDCGMVACEEPRAAEVGAEILRRGGNAADAAVATALALAVVHPQAGNLGGGGFALWVPHEGEPQALDFRETAPASAEPDRYLDGEGRPVPALLRQGPLSVGVPGTPAGLLALHERLGSGRLTLEELARPAIELARRGFRVGPLLARDLASPSTRARLGEDPGSRDRFYPRGEPLREGDLLVQPDLAATLALWAREGFDGFYLGRNAQRLVDELGRGGTSPISLEDLAGYRPRWRAPLRGWFRGREVISMPPPSSGGIILLQVLGVLEGFPLDAERREARRERELARASAREPSAEACGLGVRAVHGWIESLRRSFAERAERMGDPDFHPVPVDELLSPAWIARTRVSIGEQASREVPSPPPHEGAQTTHLSVLDGEGNAVSLTTTLNSSFGSGILVRGAGFLLNNELDDFSLPGAANQFGLLGGAANAIQPHKRPLSSMTPTVLRDGGRNVSLVIGSPGGPRIITSVIAVILRTLVYEQPLQEAVAAPRFHQQWSPITTDFEPGWPPELLEGLRRLGHEIAEESERWGSIQAIRVLPGGAVEGATDPRRPGAAVRAD